MNNKFDELAKGLAQSVTQRQAFKKFGLGLAGMALACFGLADRGQAGGPKYCTSNKDCHGHCVCGPITCGPGICGCWCF
jgi:hypothetical protein